MSKTKTKVAKDAEEIGTSKELYNFLYEACNILRGPVSQDAFKEYITPLLYFKRISDVYDEETKAALELSDGDEEFAALPEQHRFVIPEGCHWDDVRQRTSDIGSAIIGAMRQIELANPMTLYGVLSVFSTANWSNKNVFSDEKLRDLIEHMSKRRLGNGDYAADLMGDAYEMLLKKFADLSKAKAGEFYTPRSVVKLLVRILDPKPGETVYDPACGSGGMLIEAVHHMKNDEQCCGAIFGQEKNVTNAAVAKMNLFLHGANDFNIMCGDTLRDPKILANEHLAHFDCVIANPPFSLKNWGAEAWKTDRYGRNLWGTPPETIGDYSPELPRQIEAEYRDYLKTLWAEVAPNDSRTFEDIIDKQRMSDLMTEDDRERIHYAYDEASRRTLWERITQTNHKDVTYYKDALKVYTEELLLALRCDFMEDVRIAIHK